MTNRRIPKLIEFQEEQDKKDREELYNRLVQAKNKASTEKEFQELADQFRTLDYEGSLELAGECYNQYIVLKERREAQERKLEKKQKSAEENRKAKEKHRKNRRKAVIILCIVAPVIILGYGFLSGWFKEVKDYSEGMAAVNYGNIVYPKWGFIDESGKEVIPRIYSDVSSFSEGLAAVQKGGKKNGQWGFIDKSGNVVIPFKYNYSHSFAEGLAAVRTGGYWGYIDIFGNEIISPKYYRALSFNGGLALVAKGSNRGWDFGVINRNGKEIIPCDYGYSYNISIQEDIIEVKSKNGEILYFDKSGNRVNPNIQSSVQPVKTETTTSEQETEQAYLSANTSNTSSSTGSGKGVLAGVWRGTIGSNNVIVETTDSEWALQIPSTRMTDKGTFTMDGITATFYSGSQNVGAAILIDDKTVNITLNSNSFAPGTYTFTRSTSSTDSMPAITTTPVSQPERGLNSRINTAIIRAQESRQASQNEATSAPTFSTRLLREADLRGTSKQDLRFLRNEIYARHGYRFNSRDLQEYFSTKDWYRPQFDDVDHLLSEIEKENIKFIERHE